ncbi:MAG: LytTR family DNA-binding domain-containing protein [Acidobacteriota bacterium]
MKPALRCVLAEDEAEARKNLIGYLRAAPGVELVGVAANGPEAIARVDELRPDLLLLDVQMPELDGMTVLRRIRHRPEVIFTTAHEAYAVAAFELGAVDYLVKPFGRERLLAAISRVVERSDAGAGEGLRSDAVDRALSAAATPLTRLFARKGQRIVPIAASAIVRIHARGEYAEVVTAAESYLVQITLAEFSARLDPEQFVQVHRSHILNLDAIESLKPADDRRLLVTLRDGTGIVASRAASERLRRLVR